MSKGIAISFNELPYLETIVTDGETETLTSGRMIFSETNDPPAESLVNGP